MWFLLCDAFLLDSLWNKAPQWIFSIRTLCISEIIINVGCKLCQTSCHIFNYSIMCILNKGPFASSNAFPISWSELECSHEFASSWVVAELAILQLNLCDLAIENHSVLVLKRLSLWVWVLQDFSHTIQDGLPTMKQTSCSLIWVFILPSIPWQGILWWSLWELSKGFDGYHLLQCQPPVFH